MCDENLHHIAILYEVDVDSEEITNTIESFEGQDSNGAIWLALDEVTSNNSSPLVLQAIEWIRTGTIPVLRVHSIIVASRHSPRQMGQGFPCFLLKTLSPMEYRTKTV